MRLLRFGTVHLFRNGEFDVLCAGHTKEPKRAAADIGDHVCGRSVKKPGAVAGLWSNLFVFPVRDHMRTPIISSSSANVTGLNESRATGSLSMLNSMEATSGPFSPYRMP